MQSQFLLGAITGALVIATLPAVAAEAPKSSVKNTPRPALTQWYGGTSGYKKAIDAWNARIEAARPLSARPPAAVEAKATAPVQPARPHWQGGGSYLNEMVSSGAERWSAARMPLRVFIQQGGDGFRPGFDRMVGEALTEWSAASGGKISWTPAPDPGSADIQVSFAGRVDSDEPAGETRNRYAPAGDGSKLIVRSGVVLATLQHGGPISDLEMKKTALHEIGHALGLKHSSGSRDIMYFQSNFEQMASLGERDVSTIAGLYR